MSQRILMASVVALFVSAVFADGDPKQDPNDAEGRSKIPVGRTKPPIRQLDGYQKWSAA